MKITRKLNSLILSFIIVSTLVLSGNYIDVKAAINTSSDNNDIIVYIDNPGPQSNPFSDQHAAEIWERSGATTHDKVYNYVNSEMQDTFLQGQSVIKIDWDKSSISKTQIVDVSVTVQNFSLITEDDYNRNLEYANEVSSLEGYNYIYSVGDIISRRGWPLEPSDCCSELNNDDISLKDYIVSDAFNGMDLKNANCGGIITIEFKYLDNGNLKELIYKILPCSENGKYVFSFKEPITSTIDSSKVSVPSGSDVIINNISEINNENALISLQSLKDRIFSSDSVNIRKNFIMDLDASGSGNVSFNVGTTYSGLQAIVAHYHNEEWTIQNVLVDRNGYITAHFDSFSPISIMISDTTDKNSLNVNGLKAEPMSTATNGNNNSTINNSDSQINLPKIDTTKNYKVKAPKTNDSSIEYIVILVSGLILSVSLLIVFIEKKNNN